MDKIKTKTCFSLDSQIESNLFDTVLFYFTAVSSDGLNETEVSFALVFLVNLSEVYHELRPQIINKFRRYKRPWFKSKCI